MTERFCELCEKKGLKNKLQFCRVNFEEGIFVCDSEMCWQGCSLAKLSDVIGWNTCVYPFGFSSLERFLLKTPVDDADNHARKSTSKSAGKDLTKQMSSASNLTTNFYWSNSGNLCWLDSVMTILVNNRCLQLCLQKYQPKDSILQQLCTNFIHAQNLGPTKQGKALLCDIRMKVFEFLKPKIQCSMGVNDSALMSLAALLKDCAMINEKFIQECQWTFKCTSCGYTQVNRHTRSVVTFPNTTEDFSLPCGVFLRDCYRCKSPAQRSQLAFTRLPPCVIAHFVEGVKNENFLKSGFVCQGKEYELCQLIQYSKDPDHFIAWVRNANGTHWAKVDDTQDVVPKWEKGLPSLPLNEVYMTVWERAKLYPTKSVRASCVAASMDLTSFNRRRVTQSTSACPQTLSENGEEEQPKLISCKSNEAPLHSSRSPLHLVQHEVGNISAAKSQNVPCKTGTESTAGKGRKRKDSFEPYIPKKKRTSSGNMTASPVMAKPGSHEVTLTSSSGQKSTDLLTESVANEKQMIVCDSPCDSGYSSPRSNNSCVSLSAPSTRKPDSILNEIISTLDEIELPLDSLELKELTPTVNAQSSLSCSNDYEKKTDLCDSGCVKEDSFQFRSTSPCDFADINTLDSDFTGSLDSVHLLEDIHSLKGDTKQLNSKHLNNVGLGYSVDVEQTADKKESVLSPRINSLTSEVDSVLANAGSCDNDQGKPQSSNEATFCFEPSDLPEITEFIRLEAKRNKSLPITSFDDILEEIFPSDLL